jgi:predicted transcriptional regulator
LQLLTEIQCFGSINFWIKSINVEAGVTVEAIAPNFFVTENLQFKAYTRFDRKALLERQELYEELAKKIWGIDKLDEQLN